MENAICIDLDISGSELWRRARGGSSLILARRHWLGTTEMESQRKTEEAEIVETWLL